MQDDLSGASAEPLDPATWYAAVNRLRKHIKHAAGHETAHLLRRSFHLSYLTPSSLREFYATSCSEHEFEALLDLDQTAAAHALFGPRLSVQMVNSDDDSVLAGQPRDNPVLGTAASPNDAIAVLEVWIGSITATSGFAHNAVSGLNQDQRRSRSEPPLSSSVH